MKTAVALFPEWRLLILHKGWIRREREEEEEEEMKKMMMRKFRWNGENEVEMVKSDEL